MPQRRGDGIPIIVDAAGRTERLERLSVSEKEIIEEWLQERLDESPELLPVYEIDGDFGPLISIGREIDTPAGPIDNLFISPQGALTLVEAKLWRNPEARRKVVGQIIDYAKELSAWSYDDLDARSRRSKRGKSLWELASTEGDGPEDEARFVDAVARNLRRGRFLLLIVGDGIREEVERLADFLQQTPQLRFTLALVEMKIYRLDEKRRLVMPVVVGRTQEVTRAVVHVESSEGARVNVSIDIDDGTGGKGGGARRTLTQDEFFSELSQSGAATEGVEVARRLFERFDGDDRFLIDFKSSSYSLKLRDPIEAAQLFTVLVVQCNGKAYVDWLQDQLPRAGVPVEVGVRLVTETAKLLGHGLNEKYKTSWDRPIELTTIAMHYDGFVALIDQFAAEVYAERAKRNA